MRLVIFSIGIFFSIQAFAQSRTISKAKEDFSEGKYTEGLTRLHSLSKNGEEKVLQNYYKAFYFSIQRNPAFSLDSAYNCVVSGEQIFVTLSEKSQSGLCTDFLICSSRLKTLKDSLATEIYSELANRKDLPGLIKFCTNYPQSSAYKTAVQKVEELKFEQAKTANDLSLLDQFLKEYPNSKYTNQVNALREKLRYELAIKVNAIKVYQDFLADFKNSSYKQDILDRIELICYQNAKSVNSLALYKDFLTQFPSSKHNEEIQSLVYQLSYSALQEKLDLSSIEAFLSEFPKAVHAVELNKKLEELYFERAQQTNSKASWQEFIQKYPGSIHLNEARSALAAFFTIVPYLNANGRMEFRDLQSNSPPFNLTFEMVYPFENNRAIVVDNGLYGLIDAEGKYLISLFYDEIQTYLNSELVVASKRKSGLQNYWNDNTDQIYNDDWSASDLNALKAHLSSVSYYGIETQEEKRAFQRYLGSLVTKNYYSYSDFSYAGEDSEKFYNLKEKTSNEFNQMDYYIYIFCKGPFSNKKVEAVDVYEDGAWAIGMQADFPVLTYNLDDKVYVLAYKDGAFTDLGTSDHLITYQTNEVRIVRDDWHESPETYSPGSFYLATKDGKRLTKLEFNEIVPILGQNELFLCHQGGDYEQYRGMMWETIGGKYGVINKNGQVVLPFIFDYLEPVHSFAQNPFFISTINKVIPSRDNGYEETLGEVGLINAEGKELIPYSDGYNQINFQDQTCILVTKNAVMGYLSQDPGERGLYPIGGSTGVIDINRKIVLPLEYNEIWPINQAQQFVVKKGMKHIQSKEYSAEYTAIGGKYNLVNRTNQALISTPLDFLSEDLVGCIGCSATWYGEAYNGKWGVLNEQGKTIIPFTYSEIYATNLTGVFEVNNGASYKKSEYGFEQTANGKVGLSKNGTLMLPIKYDDIYVNDEYILAEIGKTKEHLQLNYQPFSFQCDDIQDIYGQQDAKTIIKAYRVGAKWGLLDKKLQPITEPIFWGNMSNEQNNHPFTFEKGFFLVDQGGLKYYVSKKGLILKHGN